MIIPTKDRAAALHDTLATILCQTVLPAEVLIIDQSKTNETREAVARIVQATKLSGQDQPQFVYVWDPTICGAGPARNRGIELARCPILLFLDDDVLLEVSFIEEILAVYSQYPNVGMVSGIISNYSKPPFREGFFERFFCLGPFRDERLPIYWNADSLCCSAPIPVRKVTGAVMSVSRASLGSERFQHTHRGRCEDVDLSWRVSRRFPTVLTPRARLTHLRTNEGRVQEYWTVTAIIDQHYLYHRYWKSGLKSRLAFFWFNCGLFTVSVVATIRQRSLGPFRALVDGIRTARAYRDPRSPAPHKPASEGTAPTA